MVSLPKTTLSPITRGQGPKPLGRARGAAMAEAVIAVTFFVLILACVLFVRDRYTERHRALTHARTCAWQYAFGNCEAVPPGCGDILSEARSGAVDSALAGAIDDAKSGAGGDKPGKVMGAGLGLVEDALAAVFGDRALARVSGSVSRPALLGGGKTGLCKGGDCGNYAIACNIAPAGNQPLADQAWNAIMH